MFKKHEEKMKRKDALSPTSFKKGGKKQLRPLKPLKSAVVDLPDDDVSDLSEEAMSPRDQARKRSPHRCT